MFASLLLFVFNYCLQTKYFIYFSHVCYTHSNFKVAKSHFQKQTVPSPPVETRYLNKENNYMYNKGKIYCLKLSVPCNFSTYGMKTKLLHCSTACSKYVLATFRHGTNLNGRAGYICHFRDKKKTGASFILQSLVDLWACCWGRHNKR